MRWTSIILKQLIIKATKHLLCHEIQKQCYNITTWDPQKEICEYVSLIIKNITEVTIVEMINYSNR